MKTIAALINARKNSSRCPGKLLRPFGNSTLIEIALEKLSMLSVDEKIFGVHEEDFINLNKYPGIVTKIRSLESATIDGPLTKVFEAVKYSDCDYFITINPCCAHVKVETIQKAVDLFKNSEFSSMTSVCKMHDWLYREDGSVLIEKPNSGDTKKSIVTYRVAHVFHIIDRKRFFDNGGQIWTDTTNDPHLFEISKIESVDVDDEQDFSISEALWNSCQCPKNHRRQKH